MGSKKASVVTMAFIKHYLQTPEFILLRILYPYQLNLLLRVARFATITLTWPPGFKERA